jgi:glycosyltransferase involved in cell wall biosynthesis
MQRHLDFECILVDDGSRDDSFRTATELTADDGRFVNLRRPEGFRPGGRGAKNYGFTRARGTYIVFFDADDVMYEDFLSERVHCLESDPGLGAAFSDMGWKVREGEPRRIFRYAGGLMTDIGSKVRDEDFWLNYIDLRFYFPPGNFMWRRDAIAGRPLWDETTTIGEDYEFHCRNFLAGVQPGHIPKPTWDYMANPDSMIATSEAVGPLLGRSQSKALVNAHLHRHLGFRHRLVRKELTWQVKILRRIVASGGTASEKRAALGVMFVRISDVLRMLGYGPVRHRLTLAALRLTASIHGATDRFYGFYSLIVPDTDPTDDNNLFSIA